METTFRMLWSLKEAFVKARGDGIAFEPLSRCDFTLHGSASSGAAVETASVSVDGQPRAEWRFFVQQLPGGHWVSTSRGPPLEAIDAIGEFTGTFGARALPADVLAAELAREEPRLQVRTVAQLAAVLCGEGG